MGVEFLWKAVLVRCVGSLKSMGGEPCWKVGLLVPRYFQWAAVAPKIGKRLGGFMSQQGLILGVDSNCSGGRKKRSGCVKKLRNRIKIEFSGGVRIDSSETSQRRRDRRSHLPNFWSCWLSRHWELPVPGSHWLSGTSDLDGQLTENSEEPVFCLTDARWFSFFGAASDLGLPA